MIIGKCWLLKKVAWMEDDIRIHLQEAVKSHFGQKSWPDRIPFLSQDSKIGLFGAHLVRPWAFLIINSYSGIFWSKFGIFFKLFLYRTIGKLVSLLNQKDMSGHHLKSSSLVGIVAIVQILPSLHVEMSLVSLSILKRSESRSVRTHLATYTIVTYTQYTFSS